MADVTLSYYDSMYDRLSCSSNDKVLLRFNKLTEIRVRRALPRWRHLNRLVIFWLTLLSVPDFSLPSIYSIIILSLLLFPPNSHQPASHDAWYGHGPLPVTRRISYRKTSRKLPYVLHFYLSAIMCKETPSPFSGGACCASAC